MLNGSEILVRGTDHGIGPCKTFPCIDCTVMVLNNHYEYLTGNENATITLQQHYESGEQLRWQAWQMQRARHHSGLSTEHLRKKKNVYLFWMEYPVVFPVEGHVVHQRPRQGRAGRGGKRH